jgi:hypothetical protein
MVTDRRVLPETAAPLLRKGDTVTDITASGAFSMAGDAPFFVATF